jgi:hypothetical protein
MKERLSIKQVMILFCEFEVEGGYKSDFERVVVCVIFMKLSPIKWLSYMFQGSVHFKIIKCIKSKY